MVRAIRHTMAILALSAGSAGLCMAQGEPPRPSADRSDRGERAEERGERRGDVQPSSPAPRTGGRAEVREDRVPAERAPAATEREVVEEGDARQPSARESEAAPAQAHRAKQILGSKVSITGEVSIGTVDDIVFDDQGYIEYLVVQNEGKLVTVPWEAAKFDFEKKMATVNITQEQFKQVPTYTTNQYPTFAAPRYRTEIYKQYNATPRVDRRVERKLDKRF